MTAPSPPQLPPLPPPVGSSESELPVPSMPYRRAVSPLAPTTQPAPRRHRRLVMIVAAVVVAVVAFFGSFLWFAWTFAGSAVDSVQANVPADATVGTCYSKGGQRLSVPCADWHHFEVLATHRFPADSPYPSRLERLAGTPSCDVAFESYMGYPVNDGGWTYALAVPTEAEWANGDRSAVCVLFNNAVIKTPGRAGG